MRTYRAVWLRATTVVLLAGWTAVTSAVLIQAPGLSALIFAAALLVLAGRGRRYGRVGDRVTTQLGPSIQFALAPPEARVLIVLVAAMTCGIGLAQMIGQSGTELVLLDAVAGMPLLLMPRTGAVNANTERDAFPVALVHPIERAQSERSVPAVGSPAAKPGHDTQYPEAHEALRARFAAIMNLPLSEEPSLRWHGGPPEMNAQRAAPPQPTDALSVAELCHAWQASSHALRLTPSPSERVRIVAARSVYLEALNQRDAAGMARWIEHGDPDSDPRRYLSTPGPSDHSRDREPPS